MGKVIFEIYHPGVLRPELRVIPNGVWTIGRNWHNDIILTDPYVSPQHLVVRLDQNGWEIEDRYSDNGMVLKGTTYRGVSVAVTAGDEIKIGKTRLRILSPDTPVENTRLFKSDLKLFDQFDSVRLMVFSFMALMIVWMIEVMSQNSDKAQSVKFLGSMIFVAAISVGWAALWAIIGRILKHRNNFVQNFTIVCLANTLFLLWPQLADWMGYLFNSPNLAIMLTTLLCGALFYLQIFSHLTVSTNLSFKSRWISTSLTISIILILGVMIGIASQEVFSDNPRIYSTLKPPVIQILPPKSIDEFVISARSVFQP